MLQQNIIAATTTAIANARIGSAAVVTNAAAQRFPRFTYSVSKCSDPMKSGVGMLERWRGSELSRRGEKHSPSAVTGSHPRPRHVDVTPSVDTVCTIPTTLALPPTLWASLVIGRSLCG